MIQRKKGKHTKIVFVKQSFSFEIPGIIHL